MVEKYIISYVEIKITSGSTIIRAINLVKPYTSNISIHNQNMNYNIKYIKLI